MILSHRQDSIALEDLMISHGQNTSILSKKKNFESGTLLRQTGAELGHAQLMLGFGFTSVHLYQIDELEI